MATITHGEPFPGRLVFRSRVPVMSRYFDPAHPAVDNSLKIHTRSYRVPLRGAPVTFSPAPTWWPGHEPGSPATVHRGPLSEMTQEPRDQKPRIRLTQLAHGAG